MNHVHIENRTDIELIMYQNNLVLKDELQRLKLEEVTLVIGDKYVCEVCDEIGINSILLVPSSADVILSFQRATEVTKHMTRFQNTISLYNNIIQSQNKTVYIFDSKENLINIPHEKNSRFENAARKLITNLMLDDEIQIIRTIKGKSIIFIGKKMIHAHSDYYVFFVHPTLYDQRTKITGVSIKSKLHLSKDFFNVFYNDQHNSAMKEKIIMYSKTNAPILILGESGTGKSRMADFIYTHNNYNQNPLYVFDCKTIQNQGWNYIFNNLSSPLYSNDVTLYFKEINLLSNVQLDKLKDYFLNTNTLQVNKVLFSFTLGLSEDNNTLISYLINHVGATHVNIAPLRERISEIHDLAMLYLNQLNKKNHQQVLGLEPDALIFLQGYHWPENIKQFKRIIKQVHSFNINPYIKLNDIKSVLDEEYKLIDTSIPNNTVRRNNIKLDQMIEDIVKEELRNNNFNQTLTAKKLGISRTTLWRILSK